MMDGSDLLSLGGWRCPRPLAAQCEKAARTKAPSMNRLSEEWLAWAMLNQSLIS